MRRKRYMKTRFVFAAIVGVLLACSAYAQEASNTWAGVGLVLAAPNHAITIMGIVPNSSASQAGLKRGMVVEKIDGAPTDGMKLKECVDKVRGAAGTKVTLELVDPKNDTTNTVELTREKIVLPLPGAPARKP